MKKSIHSMICICICAILLFSAMPVYATGLSTGSSDISGQSSSMPVVVSLGDSYSAGEGIEPYYDQYSDQYAGPTYKYTSEDWIAHRSTLAWPGFLKFNGVQLNEVRATNPSVSVGLHPALGAENGSWYFAAVSGAVSENIYSENNDDRQEKTVKQPLNDISFDAKVYDNRTYSLNFQIDAITSLEDPTAVDYVTLTLGGNDVGFVDIVTEAILGSKYVNMSVSGLKGKLLEKLNTFWETGDESTPLADKLENTYLEILEKASSATLIVAGYPQLIHINSDKSTDSWSISYEEARLIDSAVSIFNSYLEEIISSRLIGYNAVFVDVQDAFKGHEAYSGEPFINGLTLGHEENVDTSGSGFFVNSASFHPTKEGAQAYASAVQSVLDALIEDQQSTYNTDFRLSVYDVNNEAYGDYTINIEGKKYISIGTLAIEQLWNGDYSETITVTDTTPISLELPEGEYKITVVDSADSSKFLEKQIKVRKSSENTELQLYTIFRNSQENAAQSNNAFGVFDLANIPTDAVEFNGHYYYLYDFAGLANEEQNTWENALAYCQGLNGYLATITSEEENEFLFNYMKECGYESAYFGLADSASEGTWTWCNGETVSYTNWASGEPGGRTSENYGMFYYKYPNGTWNDGDFKNTTTNNGGTAFICEWGKYEVETQEPATPTRTTSDERDIVLVLDVSGSMSGTPMAETKKASINFIETILEEDASIGIVTYDNYASRASDFSVNKSSLEDIVSGIYDGGGTNIEAGLREAQSMLSSSNAKKKIIVLMSDGEPNDGKEGDALVAYADEIKEDGVVIYTLGFFESLGGYKSSAQQLMERIASDGCHYEVANADDLVFFFGDIADQLNGQKYIYVRIACPVDVTVTYHGETLSSAEDDLNTRTDFGTLSFEENEGSSYDSDDDRIKVLRLKEGVDYDVQIVGTGRGIMDYTIGFMDENGDYSDFRTFENIKITKQTVIDTEAKVSDETVLLIDNDGDGKYDVKLRAEENGYGEEVKQVPWLYIAIGGTVIIFVIIVIAALNARKKRKVN